MNADYTVRLEQVFQGPLDLLLHLVNEQEVDIHEIEIGKILDSYLAYLKALEEIDIEVAGDFLLMAATLMSIKSRSLLPRDEVDLDEELDPRDELIQRLIEYRHFKEASRELEGRMEERAHLYPLGDRSGIHYGSEEPTIDLGELTHWDLLAAFSRLMRETLANRSLRIQRDDRPLRWYVERLVGWIGGRREVTLRRLLADGADSEGVSKATLIGSFCALLELIKLGVVSAVQASPESEITIILREDLEGDLDDIVRSTEFDDEADLGTGLELEPRPAEEPALPSSAPGGSRLDVTPPFEIDGDEA
jgi:segregation and condensation protein A